MPRSYPIRGSGGLPLSVNEAGSKTYPVRDVTLYDTAPAGVVNLFGVGGVGRGGSLLFPTPVINIIPGLANWSAGSYALGNRVNNGGFAFECITAGTSVSGPTGTSADSTDGGTAHWRFLTYVHFTNIYTAFTGGGIEALAPWPFTQDITIQFWRNGAGAIPAQNMFWYPVGSSAYTLTITAGPGESFRDRGDIALYYNSANGVAFESVAIDIEPACKVIIDGLQFYGIKSNYYLSSGYQWIVRNCIYDGGPGARGPVTFVGSRDTYTAYNCLFRNTSNTGVATYSNSTFVDNSLIQGITLLRNNILSQAPSAGASGPVDHNALVSANWGSAVVTDNGGNLYSQTLAALFVNPASDFRLKAGSNAINAGVNYAPEDIRKTIRPQGAGYDIGPHEYPDAAVITQITPTGQGATAAIGTPTTPSAGTNVTPTGQAASAAIGTLTTTATSSATASLTGLPATAAIGAATVTLVMSQSVTLTGVSATGSLGTIDALESTTVALTGVATSTSIGTVTPSLVADRSVTLTGQPATVALGSPSISTSMSATLVGQQALFSIGLPDALEATTVALAGVSTSISIGSPAIAMPVALAGFGLIASPGTATASQGATVALIGRTLPVLMGAVTPAQANSPVLASQALTASLGTVTPQGISTATLIGREVTVGFTNMSATAVNAFSTSATLPTLVTDVHMGVVVPFVSAGQIRMANGLQTNVQIGAPIPIPGVNAISIPLPSMIAQTAVGIPSNSLTTEMSLSGRQVIASMGSVHCVISLSAAMRLEDLFVIEVSAPVRDRDVSLSWSDNKGETFGNPVERSIGEIGETFTSLSWRRLAMGRDRVFALSWSCDVPTALTGISIVVEQAKT